MVEVAIIVGLFAFIAGFFIGAVSLLIVGVILAYKADKARAEVRAKNEEEFMAALSSLRDGLHQRGPVG